MSKFSEKTVVIRLNYYELAQFKMRDVVEKTLLRANLSKICRNFSNVSIQLVSKHKVDNTLILTHINESLFKLARFD